MRCGVVCVRESTMTEKKRYLYRVPRYMPYVS